jgi:hypothetical protein
VFVYFDRCKIDTDSEAVSSGCRYGWIIIFGWKRVGSEEGLERRGRRKTIGSGEIGEEGSSTVQCSAVRSSVTMEF